MAGLFQILDLHSLHGNHWEHHGKQWEHDDSPIKHIAQRIVKNISETTRFLFPLWGQLDRMREKSCHNLYVNEKLEL